MTEVPSNAPQATFADIAVGAGFTNAAGTTNYIKSADGNGITLDGGQVHAIAAGDPVVSAPNAQFTMFP